MVFHELQVLAPGLSVASADQPLVYKDDVKCGK